MEKSEQINELAAALAKAQGQMEGAKKDSENPFFKSKYADLAAVVEAIRGPFAEHGLSYVQLPEACDGEEVAVETVLMHASGQWITSRTRVPVTKKDAQGYGSALTYARRYGLQAIAGVAAEDDDGNAAASAAPKAKRSHAVTRLEAPDLETAGAEAEALFNPDPAVPVTVVDRDVLLGKITACSDMLRMKAEDKRSAWARYVGDYDRKTAPIEKLQAFLAELSSMTAKQAARTTSASAGMRPKSSA